MSAVRRSSVNGDEKQSIGPCTAPKAKEYVISVDLVPEATLPCTQSSWWLWVFLEAHFREGLISQQRNPFLNRLGDDNLAPAFMCPWIHGLLFPFCFALICTPNNPKDSPTMVGTLLEQMLTPRILLNVVQILPSLNPWIALA